MQEQERKGAGSQQDASDSLSMHSPGPSEASGAPSGRGSAPLEEEPAMISFEDDVGPATSSRGIAGDTSLLQFYPWGAASRQAADACLLLSQSDVMLCKSLIATPPAERALVH